LEKNLQKVHDNYVYILNDVKATAVRRMERYAKRNEQYDREFLEDTRMRALSELDGIKRAVIWTVENEKLKQAVLDYYHIVWADVLKYEYNPSEQESVNA
jgi:NAD+--asparagine ADP-ribosyltransferase